MNHFAKEPESACRTCGSRWSRFEFQDACPECGEGALQIPCPLCSGTCGAMWGRAVLDSNDSGEAHWIGRCYHRSDRYAGPNQPSEGTSRRHLFRFGYQTPDQWISNRRHGDDAESCAAVFIHAPTKRDAARLGRAYADLFVSQAFNGRSGGAGRGGYVWSELGFSEWIEEDLQELALAESQNLPELRSPTELASHFLR